MKTSLPKITVCVPVYNGEKYLAATLSSLLEQDYPDYEVIVSDNQSTDGTAAIAQEFAAKSPRFSWSPAPQRYGAAEHNFNRCLGLGTGELVAVYHADDIYHRDMLRKCAEALAADPALGAVATLAEKIGPDGRVAGDGTFFYANEFEAYDLRLGVGEALRVGCSPFMCSSAMFRRAVLAAHGLRWEHERYRSASDLGLFLKLLRHAGLRLIKERLMGYRISQGQGSTALIKNRTLKGDYFRVLRDYRELIAGSPYEGRYCLSLCKDLLVRALNFAYSGETRRSARRARLCLGLWAARLGLLRALPQAWLLPPLALLVMGLYLLPAALRRRAAAALLRAGRPD